MLEVDQDLIVYVPSYFNIRVNVNHYQFHEKKMYFFLGMSKDQNLITDEDDEQIGQLLLTVKYLSNKELLLCPTIF